MDELASLQESAREMALERFRIIQPHLEHDRSLSLIARTTKIPYRTIHRWLTRYRRFGLAALARKAREDRGERRTLSPRLMQVAEALALEVPPLARARQWHQRDNPSQESAKAAEPLETELMTRPNDMRALPQNPVQMDLFLKVTTDRPKDEL